MSKYEVSYTYCIDVSVILEADSPEAAEARAHELWRKGETAKERLEDFADFEILKVKKLSAPKPTTIT